MTPMTTTLDSHARRTRASRRGVAVRIALAMALIAGVAALSACARAEAAARTYGASRHAPRVLSQDSRDPVTPAGVLASWPAGHARSFDPTPFLATPVKHGDMTGRMVALTFDDGPSVDSTAVLDILRGRHAVATFFYVGDRVFGHPLIPALAASQGCDVGNHTLHHVEMVGLTRAQMLDQVQTTNGILSRAIGRPIVLFRPRSGHADAAARALVARLGMVMVLWDGRDGDTDATATVAGITRQALENAHGGSIILMHETNPKTVAALPAIIDGLRAKGLTPVTLSTMLAAEGKPGAIAGGTARRP